MPRATADPDALDRCAIATPITRNATRADIHAPSVEVACTHPHGAALRSEHTWVKIALALLDALTASTSPGVAAAEREVLREDLDAKLAELARLALLQQ